MPTPASIPPWFSDSASRATRGRGFIIAGGFVALAAWLAWGSPNIVLPNHGTPPVDRAQISSEPLRQPMISPPAIPVAGYSLGCMECHRLFAPPRSGMRGTPIQHRHISLDHGMNTHCLNCHDPVNRDYLSVRGGPLLSFDEAPLLCAGCHGTTYRDWTRGIHGRTSGYWDSKSGEVRRLVCTHCHDPHAPAFAPMSVLPGPHTLRLEVHRSHADLIHKSNPLQRLMRSRPDAINETASPVPAIDH